MRYSRLRPLNCSRSGCLLNICRSSHSSAGLGCDESPRLRYALSDDVEADPLSKSERALGLAVRSSAVTPASLWTFTRNCRHPFSTSSGLAAPGATFTRDSGLIFTPNRQYLSSTRWMASLASSASDFLNAASSVFLSAALSGEPKYSAASITRRTCATSGCNSTFLTMGKVGESAAKAEQSGLVIAQNKL